MDRGRDRVSKARRLKNYPDIFLLREVYDLKKISHLLDEGPREEEINGMKAWRGRVRRWRNFI